MPLGCDLYMFPGVNFYGIKQLLLSYAGLPRWLPFPVAVQHGWLRLPTSFESNAFPPEIWVWSHRIKAEMEKFYPSEKIRVVGSFFCYLMKIIGKSMPPVEPCGSICIPPHSSHFTKTGYSAEDFARKVELLGDEYKPITVMLYYLDMEDEVVKIYERRGFKVVSNGSLFSSEFLFNFVKNVYGKKHCIYSDMGSGVFFAAELGLTAVHVEIPSSMTNMGDAHVTEDFILAAKNFDKGLSSGVGKTWMLDELGKECLISPKEMRAILLKNYRTKRFVYVLFRSLCGKVLRRILQLAGLRECKKTIA